MYQFVMMPDPNQLIAEVAIKGSEHLVRVNNNEGKVLVCGLDCEVGSELT